MSEFTEFSRRAREVYRGMQEKGAIVTRGGIRPDPVILKRVGGYGVVLRHGLIVTQGLERFSAQLTESVGGVRYGAYNAHTSVCVYDSPGYRYLPDVEDNILQGVAGVVRRCMRRMGTAARRSCRVSFSPLIYNQHSVLAPGEVSRGMYDFIMSVVAGCQALLSEFRVPWGGHMTVHRFTEARLPERLAGFLELMKNPPAFGNSRPVFVDVVHFTVSPLAFSLATVDRVEL